MSIADSLLRLINAPPAGPPLDATSAHRVSVIVDGQQFTDWTSYEINTSMITPADQFSLERPFDRAAYLALKPDAEVLVAIDSTPVAVGYIDDRELGRKAGTLRISGRDKVGRLVQESIPNASGWDGLKLDEAARQVAAPWFTRVVLENARNRTVARGKGHKASANDDVAHFKVKGKLDEEHAGRIDPGEMRWNVLHQLASSVRLLVWSSTDGRELIIGEPNYTQAVQFHFRLDNTTDIKFHDSVRDAYSLIECHGAADTDDFDFGGTYLGTAKDGPNADGTGKNFSHPKRLVLSQRAQASNAEAQRSAQREMAQRSFKIRQCTIEAATHGQVIAGVFPTIFTFDTLARVSDPETTDEVWLIYACTYRGSRQGEVTTMHLVPRGTEFVG